LSAHRNPQAWPWYGCAATCLIAALFFLGAPVARAHEFKLDALVNAFVKVDRDEAHVVVRAPLYLFKNVHFPVKATEVDLAGSPAAMARALALIEQDLVLLEDGQPLAAASAVGRLALPSDRSFDSFEDAARHVATPIDPETHIVIDQGYVDAHLVYPIKSPDGVFALRSTIAPELGDYLKIAVRYLDAKGESRSMVLRGGVGTVDLNPTWFSAAAGFVAFGIAHIVTGVDHLLFLLCLVIPLRGVRQLLTVVTGFTLAHSFTLIGSAFGLAPHGAWFPPFVEFVIALSIVYTALENIIGIDVRRRVLLTILFGLVHGFGFSYGLKEDLQFAGSHLLVSLFAFNVGIELGQIMVLALMLPALALVTRTVLPGRVGLIILCALVAHVGWHWMIDRWDVLNRERWPSLDLASLPVLLFWIAGLAVAAGAAVVVTRRLRLEGAQLRSARADVAADTSAGE
jgi:HupE / UreJ protein